MNFSEYTIEDLIRLKDQITDYIYNHEDGYVYICNVRSYGRSWVKNDIKNKYSLQDLMYQYDGEDGIVDVYTTNPHLGDMDNYGELMYIESVEDYQKWDAYQRLKNLIPEIEEDLDKWDNRENVPFRDRPYFAPVYTREDLDEYKKELDQYDMSFVSPRRFLSE